MQIRGQQQRIIHTFCTYPKLIGLSRLDDHDKINPTYHSSNNKCNTIRSRMVVSILTSIHFSFLFEAHSRVNGGVSGYWWDYGRV